MVQAKYVVAVLVVLMAAQAAQARHLLTTTPVCKVCPNLYKTLTIPGVDACPLCYRPARLNCTGSASQPYCCGGASNIICPSISCSTSSSYAISGSNSSCTAARSTVSAVAFSNSTYNFKALYTPVLKAYCENGPTTGAISAYVSQLVSAYSEAVATTLIQYSTYVCACVRPSCGSTCTKDSVAYSVVSADVMAVARAQASTLSEALAQVNTTCFGGSTQLLSEAQAAANAVASDVNVALDELFKTASSQDSTQNCELKCGKPQIKQAIAKAVACSYVKIFALARDACTPGVSYSCASTIALAGSDAIPANFQCAAEVKCKPEYTPIYDNGYCKLANEILAPEFDAYPVPSTYNVTEHVPAPTEEDADATEEVTKVIEILPGQTGVTELTFKYPYDQNAVGPVVLSSPVKVLDGTDYEGWCGRYPELLFEVDGDSLTFTLPAGTTAFAVRLDSNVEGKFKYSGTVTGGQGIGGDYNVIEQPDKTKYVGFYVKSWFLETFTIKFEQAYTSTTPTGFVFGEVYISDTLVDSGIGCTADEC